MSEKLSDKINRFIPTYQKKLTYYDIVTLHGFNQEVEVLENRLANVEALVSDCLEAKTSVLYLYELEEALKEGKKY